MGKTEQMKPILSYEKLKGLLPEISQVFFTLGDIRGSAAQYRSHLSREDYEPFPYANIIGILGGRGSGKTTVFSTIRTILESGHMPPELESEPKNSGTSQSQDAQGQNALEMETVKAAFSPDDLHIKPIVPEVLETSADILGVILLKLKDIIISNANTLAKYYKKRDENYPSGFESCHYSEKLPLEEQWEKVFRSYLVRANGYNEISSRNYSSLSDYTKERQESLDAEVRLGGQIYDLFTQISTAFSNGGGNCLIHFYIDDADIDGKRCMETMQLILRYLKHPNVVVFVSGDINKFEEVLLIQQLLQDKSAIMLKENSALKSVHQQAKDYIYELLKKVMPYSNRYFLQQLDTEGKKRLQYPGDLDKKEPFSDFLSNRLFYKLINSGEGKSSDSQSSHQVLPSCVYDIFDSKPRGIITIWEFIEKNFPGKQSTIRPTSDIPFKNLLRNITEVNERFSRYKENILTQWIQISFIEPPKGQSSSSESESLNPLKVTINYDKFINFVTQHLQVESDFLIEENRKTIPEIKRERQESLCCIVSLFYFCEKFSFVGGGNAEPEGKKYSAMLNAIVTADEDHLVYYSTPKASHVLELFTQLQQVLSIDQQALIFSEELFFHSYETVIETKNTDYSVSDMDTRWNNQYAAAKKKFEKRNGSVIQELYELFDGVEYDPSLLLSSRTWKDWFPLNESQERGFPKASNLSNDVIDQNLKSLQEDLISRFVQFYLKQLNSSQETDEKQNSLSESKKQCEANNELLSAIKESEFATEASFYSNVTDSTFLRQSESLSGEYFSSKQGLRYLTILRNYAVKRLRGNSYMAQSTVSHLKANYLFVSLNSCLLEYLEAILNLMKKEIPDSTLADLAVQLFTPNKYAEKKCLPCNANIPIGFAHHLVFQEISDCPQSHYFIYSKPDFSDLLGGWYTRRHNAIRILVESAALCYIALRCEELRQDFFFINAFRLQEIYGKKQPTADAADKPKTEASYQKIYEFYYAKYHGLFTKGESASTAPTTLYAEIRELREKMAELKSYYTLENLNLSSLSKLLHEIHDEVIYQEASALKNDLQASQRIEKQRWDQFSERFALYIDSFQEKNPYYAATLKQIQSGLLYEDKTDRTSFAASLEDVENEERSRIYQTEYEALILVAKAYLEAKQKSELSNRHDSPKEQQASNSSKQVE